MILEMEDQTDDVTAADDLDNDGPTRKDRSLSGSVVGRFTYSLLALAVDELNYCQTFHIEHGNSKEQNKLPILYLIPKNEYISLL